MRNFYRAIAITFRHRLTVVASLLCALAVAVLWGGNITAIYPVVDVIMNNKSVPQYLDEQRVLAEKRVAELKVESPAAEAKVAAAAADAAPPLKAQATKLREEQARKEKEVARYIEWIPTARRLLPTTAFKTLVIVCTFLIIG